MTIKKIQNQLILPHKMKRLDLKKIDTIALHHMASSAGVKDIERIHVSTNGWGAIGYNYWIGYDGTVYEGRGLKYVAAGVANHNSHVLSIGFQGNYHPSERIKTDTSMPMAQFDAGVILICELLLEVGSVKKVVGHKYFGGSVCPGQYFPLEKMIKEAYELLNRIKNIEKRLDILEKKENVYNWTTACPKWAQPYVQKALDMKIIQGAISEERMLKLLPEGIEEYIDELDAARFLTFCQHNGIEGYYVTNAKMASSEKSDYTHMEYTRAMCKVFKKAQTASAELIQSNFDSSKPKAVLKAYAEYIAAPLENMVKASELSDAWVEPLPDQNVTADANLKFKIFFVPRGIGRTFSIVMSMSNPRLNEE